MKAVEFREATLLSNTAGDKAQFRTQQQGSSHQVILERGGDAPRIGRRNWLVEQRLRRA